MTISWISTRRAWRWVFII